MAIKGTEDRRHDGACGCARHRGGVERMIEQDRQTWRTMLQHLRATHPGLCRQWFEDLEPMGIERGMLRLRAHSGVHRDYLQRQCVEQFKEAAQAVSGRLLSVTFLGPDEEPEPTRAGAESAAAAAASTGTVSTAPSPAAVIEFAEVDDEDLYADGLVFNPDYTFENFVVGPGNRLAHAAAQAVAANPGRTYNPFFVHGDVGLGKTHLLQAVCLRIKEQRPQTKIYYTSCEAFMTQFVDAVQRGALARFHHKFRDVDVLVVDDIHFLAKRDRTQEEFFHTFNSLYQAHRQIVLSSDAPPEEIPDLEDRLVSRFKWGLVTNVDSPGYETRVEILKNKARLRGFELPEEVASYVAAKIDTNIRELEGAVVQIQMRATIDKQEIDLDLAKQALGEEPERSPERQVQIQMIINVVTEYYGVKTTDLQSKRRHRSVAQPRQVCMYLARRLTRYSLEEIGGYFGGRDHTTVMHAIKTVDERGVEDPEFATTLTMLEDRARTRH
ncbi:MAG: chromosomal replication initiator protein DnaA [Phycisphaeraceae bacterium]|nr:chromosomal replication initiator protein DnaA [Phycisphaeraceae bacterium]